MRRDVRGCVFGAWLILCDQEMIDTKGGFPYGSVLHDDLDAAFGRCRRRAREDGRDLAGLIAAEWAAGCTGEETR